MTAILRSFLSAYSLEVTCSRDTVAEACAIDLPKGTNVFIAFVPGENHRHVVTTAAALRRAGLEPVPHIAVRSLAGPAALDDVLAALAAEAGVTRALLIAGDIAMPSGPFAATIQALRTGAFQRHGITAPAFACHVEPHPKVATDILDDALATKLDFATANGMHPWLVTQFCFDSAPILNRLAKLRRVHPEVPVQVGIAGPASRRALWKYALYCGIGASIRALGERPSTVQQLAQRETPDRLVTDLANAAAAQPELGVGGAHFFTFGGVAETVRWAEALAGRTPPLAARSRAGSVPKALNPPG
jgi:methylenetetrahydrofolate reductase (NADPH)